MRTLVIGLLLVALVLGVVVWQWKRHAEPKLTENQVEAPAAVAEPDTSTGWTPADTTQTGP